MATRLYLPASGTPFLPALAVNTNWELTNSLVRLSCYTAKKNTALAIRTSAWPAATTQQWCWYQYQTPSLAAAYDWTTLDTVSMVIGKCAETTTSGDTHLAYVVRVVSRDGSAIRGVIGLYHTTSTEYPLVAAAATRIHNARTNGATTFSSQIGDRIIIEIGLHGVTPALENIQMRVGDPSATADFALTAALTTDLCPWVQLSRTVVFGVPLAGTAAFAGSLEGAAKRNRGIDGRLAGELTSEADTKAVRKIDGRIANEPARAVAVLTIEGQVELIELAGLIETESVIELGHPYTRRIVRFVPISPRLGHLPTGG